MKKELNQEACRIITAIGGTSATARLCNVEPPSVTEWKYNGIPDARLMFLKLAWPDVFSPAGPITPSEAEAKRNGGIRSSGDDRDRKNIGK